MKDLNYDIISYDAGDVRNKLLIDNITSNNISNYYVLDMMKGVKKKIAIIMDEIDGMNNGDKGGITSLIKLIRQKKTKKQKLENKTVNPIICIGNYYVDKKINELIKVCNSYELKAPTRNQMEQLLNYVIPETQTFSKSHYNSILNYIQGDMRKLFFIKNLYKKNPNIISEKYICRIFHIKLFNEDPKVNIYKLFKNSIPLEQHNVFMNETDRTIVALLWHENIIDILEKKQKISNSFSKFDFPSQATENRSSPILFSDETFNTSTDKESELNINSPSFHSGELRNFPYRSADNSQFSVACEGKLNYKETSKEKIRTFEFYLKVLKNICFADYIDRITFQNQIWNFNEMSSLIKTFHNNKLYHEEFKGLIETEAKPILNFHSYATEKLSSPMFRSDDSLNLPEYKEGEMHDHKKFNSLTVDNKNIDIDINLYTLRSDKLENRRMFEEREANKNFPNEGFRRSEAEVKTHFPELAKENEIQSVRLNEHLVNSPEGNNIVQ